MYRESLFSAVGDHVLWVGVGRIIKSLNGGASALRVVWARSCGYMSRSFE